MQVHNPSSSDIEAGWISLKAGETITVNDDIAQKAISTWGFLAMSPDPVVEPVREPERTEGFVDAQGVAPASASKELKSQKAKKGKS